MVSALFAGMLLLVGAAGWALIAYQRPACSASSVEQLCRAFDQRSVRITIWGDSISEGISQVEYANSWPGRLLIWLSETYPTVSWNLTNLSVAGQSMEVAANPASVVAPTVAPWLHPENVWPEGYGSDRTWFANIKKSDPDLLFIAFGMNASDPEQPSFKHALQSAIEHALTWESPPTILLVTPMTPSSNPASLASPRDWVANTAQITRAVAAQYGLRVIDASAFSDFYKNSGYTDEDLIGTIGGTNGNGMNHPTALGHDILYFRPAAEFLSREFGQFDRERLGSRLRAPYHALMRVLSGH